jgi:hypothetical protein
VFANHHISLLDNDSKIFPIKGQMIVVKAEINALEHIVLDQGLHSAHENSSATNYHGYR